MPTSGYYRLQLSKKAAISSKVKRIMTEGIRRNTHKSVSSSNSRRPVSQKQAVAVALSMAGLSNKGRK